jgi:hypothetical protein
MHAMVKQLASGESRRPRKPASFIAFDLLWFNGEDLRGSEWKGAECAATPSRRGACARERQINSLQASEPIGGIVRRKFARRHARNFAPRGRRPGHRP